MLLLKYLLFAAGIVLWITAALVVLHDIYRAFELDRLLSGEAVKSGEESQPALPRPRRVIRWSKAGKLSATAILPLLLGLSIVVVPDGKAGVRISQISGVRPGTLYSGIHFVKPLLERVATFDVRDHVYSTSSGSESKQKGETLEIEAKEGLPLGLAVSVRYRIDPKRLDYLQENLPQPMEGEFIAPVITSAFHSVAPNYVVREVFATKREEFRARAAEIITRRLNEDGIIVKEVLLLQVQLPGEYAQGLQDLLLKEQEDDRTSVEAGIEQKRVKVAEFQAEALKVRQVKRAEADAQSRVIQAKAESDSMQYTLPLKQKQIEQSKLEAQARKEATVENAEAEARAKVIDSKAELERRNLFADAEANRIRVTSAAEAEKMRLEGIALKANPLLIQKIIAERLSDKVQIMMVPADGKYFFANDVLRSIPLADRTAPIGKDSGELPARSAGGRP
ncbi:MAG: SPFH domain-containing protein [Candidatus Acidiferrales bacterium]